MEQKNIMKFMDEDGNEVELEVVERINIEKKEYLLLAPLDEDSDDVFAFRIDKVNDKEEYNLVEDDEEFNRVKDAYDKLFEQECDIKWKKW